MHLGILSRPNHFSPQEANSFSCIQVPTASVPLRRLKPPKYHKYRPSRHPLAAIRWPGKEHGPRGWRWDTLRTPCFLLYLGGSGAIRPGGACPPAPNLSPPLQTPRILTRCPRFLPRAVSPWPGRQRAARGGVARRVGVLRGDHGCRLLPPVPTVTIESHGCPGDAGAGRRRNSRADVRTGCGGGGGPGAGVRRAGRRACGPAAPRSPRGPGKGPPGGRAALDQHRGQRQPERRA